MSKISLAAELPISAAEMFVERDSAAFQALMCKALNLAVMEFRSVKRDEANDADVVELVTKPDMEQYVPKHLKRYMSFDLVFVDTITYKRDLIQGPTYTLPVESKLPGLKDSQYSIKTQLCIEPLGPDRCRQTLTGEVKINILGLGSVVSGIVLNSLKTAYLNLPEVVERWVAFKKEALKTPEGRNSLLAGRPEVSVIPPDIMGVLQQPYKDTNIDNVESPVKRMAAEGFAGELRRDSGIYFDAVDYLNVDISDEITKEAVLADKLELLNDVTEDVEIEWGETESDHSATPKADRQESQHSPFGEDWNEHRRSWSDFWNDVGVATAKVPNMPARLLYYVDSMASLGKLKFKKHHSLKKEASLPAERNGDMVKSKSSLSKGAGKVKHGVKSIVHGVASVPKGVVKTGEYVVEGVASSFSELMKRPSSAEKRPASAELENKDKHKEKHPT